ncbi:MAG: hypothetical protein ACI8PP_001475 [Candidatus Pseudothioglobus sp.]|jgi:hypothetical protein
MTILSKALNQLRQQPKESIPACWNQRAVTIQLGIPHYKDNLQQHYQVPASNFTRFRHFGLIIEFGQATELALHDEDMRLPAEARVLMEEFGPILLRNVSLPEAIETVGHRNHLPHLNFHRNRNPHERAPYSLLYRSPFDDTQGQPGTASTLFVSNQHARAELNAKGQGIMPSTDLSHCYLYKDVQNATLVKDFLGTRILEQPWNLAEGTGEICLKDNRQLMHASYFHNASHKGYQIGERYLA